MTSHTFKNNQLNTRYFKYKYEICNKLSGTKITPCFQCGQYCDQEGENWFLRGKANVELTMDCGPAKCQNT